VKCRTSTQVQLDHPSVWSIENESMTRSRGKNTCEAPEIAAAILLQVHRRSEELCFSKASGRPCESNARENAQSRSFVRAMSDPAGAESGPQCPLYIVHEVSDRTNADGLPTPGYFVILVMGAPGKD
jgi:hypothetical protein